MTMLKVIEVLAESETSWEDAAHRAVAEASSTVRQVRSIYIENMQATVENGRIARYRINAKITFALESER
ncbi:dodecin family protein [Brevundimonas sp.]|uniref:dodecin family protein n=1 Tax=Brevundimonas sp. TaxID=1871086 RepID=UPI002C7EB3F1|nr:dodecin family protein [Brevundimonas sp.]HWQ86820.1 dodecin family protein [Brevundimonas sp.]